VDDQTRALLPAFRTCLVCPERWGRPDDIQGYADRLRHLDFALDAVMTGLVHAPRWERLGLFRAAGRPSAFALRGHAAVGAVAVPPGTR
jgi:hypothetical protein